MRPYYVGRDTEERLAKMTPKNRRRVLAHARYLALLHADPGDIDRHLYVVTARHLAECGFPKRGGAPVVSAKEEFLDHMAEHNARTGGRFTSRWILRKMMKHPSTFTHEAWLHFKAGWSRRADIEL